MIDKNITSTNISVENQKPESSQKTTTKVKPVITDKKKVSNTIKKNISTFKSTTSTVQALKKKYQEQRLAKQRIKNKFKTSCVMRTRSCTERTLLKSVNKLAPRKFLPRIETKRLGLRSSVLADKTKKGPSKVKSISPKPKKKIIMKQKDSDTSNSDSTSEEEGPSEKSVPQIKRTIQKTVQKNICTRSKSEMRRITRSHSGTISPKNLCRRPTRKTKEAAAVYMEILGRKLVSPDLENDDNVSMDSFPELPNTRKISQTENEVKSKVKQSITKTTKNKDNKISSIHNTSNKRLDKTKTNKITFKSKRLIRVHKYCEVDSDEESISSNGTNNTRPVTRRSLGKLNKPINRYLRSSTKNVTTRIEIEDNINIKPKSQNNLKFNKEKFVMKRKREQNMNKSLSEKINGLKQKEIKNTVIESTDSDEETLGMLLNKLKRKKNDNIQKDIINKNNDHKGEDKIEQPLKENLIKTDLSKISDDEESFRGFTKKAISKVLNSCQTHVNVNLLVTKKTNDKLETTKIEDEQTSNVINKQENKKELSNNEPLLNTNSSPMIHVTDNQHQKLEKDKLELPDLISDKIEHKMKNAEKECHHKTEISSIDMSLSTLHIRKEKVNMSTEQIEKWLNESSLAKEESKLEMENVSTFKYDACEKKTDISHLSISTKIQHLVRPVNVTLSKLTEKANIKDRINTYNKYAPIIAGELQSDLKQHNELSNININKHNTNFKDINKGLNIKLNKDSCSAEEGEIALKSDHVSVDNSNEKKLLTEKKTIFQPRKPFLPKVKERKTVTPNANAFSPENESSVYAFESDTEVPVNTPFRRKIRESNKSNTSFNLSETNTSKSENNTNKSKNNTNKFEINENKSENNINKFDNSNKSENMTNKSENETNKNIEKTSKNNCERTFKENSNNSSKSENEIVEIKNISNTTLNVNKFELPKNFATLANIQVLPLDKLTTTWSNVNCSTSIAVQVNLDDNVQTQKQVAEGDVNQQKSTEISTQTESNNENDDENDGQLFYIPLQAVTRNGPNLIQGQQLIQGVAVKLGTEGPNGPNQKVLLRAKLVTKPPSSIARCPPIGTVQPTTRSPPNSTLITTDHSIPSTSSNITSIVSTSNSEFQSSSLNKNENILQTTCRQTIGTALNIGIEKLPKSPKTSRERKTSIDSNKNGKR